MPAERCDAEAPPNGMTGQGDCARARSLLRRADAQSDDHVQAVAYSGRGRCHSDLDLTRAESAEALHVTAPCAWVSPTSVWTGPGWPYWNGSLTVTATPTPWDRTGGCEGGVELLRELLAASIAMVPGQGMRREEKWLMLKNSARNLEPKWPQPYLSQGIINY